MLWNKEDLSNALQVQVANGGNNPKFDSRNVEPGDIFLALKGTQDGHDFVAQAFEQGASLAIVDRIPKGIDDHDKLKLVIVPDTQDALLKLANYRRQQFTGKVIGITGSCGKTSTKTHLSQILSKFGKTYFSPSSFNNHVGCPISLASVPLDADYAILEIGTNAPGEISYLTKLVQPEIAILINVYPSHIGNFASMEDLIDEKCQIFASCNPKPIAIVHEQENVMAYIKKQSWQDQLPKLLTFGKDRGDAYVESYQLLSNDKAKIKIQVDSTSAEFETPVLGEQYASNFAAIFLACRELGIALDGILTIMSHLEHVKGRGERITLNVFGKQLTVIDETYNANPASMKAALENFALLQHEKKVLVLADMLELGKDSKFYHTQLQDTVKRTGARKIILIGPFMKTLYDQIEGIEKYHFQSAEELIAELEHLVADQELWLAKGSLSMKLGQLINHLSNLATKNVA